MEPIKTYTLEKLNENTVNVLIITTIELNEKTYEIERSRTCYGNSPIGRAQVSEQLPEQYVRAIFEIWGNEPTIEDPTSPQENNSVEPEEKEN